ncbi:TMV resistance protein N-like [Prunus dulcis]|uniref:TMV resistance protein N-like n=1 Tax=Prunus dulcis TaxID=3755 RepID=UPI0014838897|nr:TMV resistance protein N-like [Prunus dulcis]
MSSSSTSLPSNAIKLDGTNYPVWLAKAIPILQSRNLMGYVDGTKPCPDYYLTDAQGKITFTVDPAYDRWIREDRMVQSWINASLAPSVLSVVANSTTARNAWLSLEKRYASQSHNPNSATTAAFAFASVPPPSGRGGSPRSGSTSFRGRWVAPSVGASSTAYDNPSGNGNGNGNVSSPSSYHVFLSFRGEDTRKTFSDHLYTAFVKAGLRTFRDDDELKRGEHIQPEVLRAIKESKCFVIVFSKEYASSLWCLDELVMILDRKRSSNSSHVVLPVFYDVDPSQVRKQTGSFATAFARHEMRHSLETTKRWRAALTEVADVAGMVLQNEADGHEAKFIQKIVKVIEDRLSRTPLSAAPHLIGIDYRVKNINLWLQDQSTDVGILAIYGMRGTGKTTVAKFVYDSNFRRFEASSFLENIKGSSEQPNGLVQVQKQLLTDILDGRKVKVNSVSEAITKVEDAISSKRILLVLDDVDHMDKLLDLLLRMKDRSSRGSKIIITTSNVGLLRSDRYQVIKVHDIGTFRDSESLELFSWHAFGKDHPIEGYKEISKKVVNHCRGLPVALKTLGSSLSGQSMVVWKSALEKLEAIPKDEIMKKLKVSYDSLQDDHDRDLFLHIACFFIGMENDVMVRILDGCGFHTIVGIQNLLDRCLIRIDRCNKVQMNHMIRDMGRGIVGLESKQSGQRNRLWRHKDSFEVLTENSVRNIFFLYLYALLFGTENIEGLILDMRMHPAYSALSRRSNVEVVLETNAFAKMNKLKLLQLSHVQLEGNYQEFPKGLRWLSWHQSQLEMLPIDFPLKSLVVLEMCYSSLRRFWNQRTECLPTMKILNLSHSHYIKETPDFSFVPNLEVLILKDCPSLVDVHESIGKIETLTELNMEDCKNVRKLDISQLRFLETLIISGCSNLNEFPMDMRKMKSLKVFQADPIHQLLHTAEDPEVELGQENIPEMFWTSYIPSNLVDLSLGNCNLSDDDFPTAFRNLSSLQNLNLSGNPIRSLPDCIRGLKKLYTLSFSECTRLKYLVRLPKVGEHIVISGCTSLEKISYQSISYRPTRFVIGSNWKLALLQGCFKFEPIDAFDDAEMINLLGLTNWASMRIITDTTHDALVNAETEKKQEPIKGLYENGIFSTFLPGDQVPKQFSHYMDGLSVSYTVPLLPNLKIRGLNVFAVYTKSDTPSKYNYTRDSSLRPIMGQVDNKTSRVAWTYGPLYYGVPRDGEDVTWLSHWRFGDQVRGGDEMDFKVFPKAEIRVKKCGIQVVYEQGEKRWKSYTEDPFYPNVISGETSVYGFKWDRKGTYFITHSTPGPTADYITNHFAPDFNYLGRIT